jgi:hypothetical protein
VLSTATLNGNWSTHPTVNRLLRTAIPGRAPQSAPPHERAKTSDVFAGRTTTPSNAGSGSSQASKLREGRLSARRRNVGSTSVRRAFEKGRGAQPDASKCSVRAAADVRLAGAGARACERTTRRLTQAAFFSAFRHLVQRSSLLVSFLWKVWPQLMQISRPLSFLPMPLIVASRASTWQKCRQASRAVTLPVTLGKSAARLAGP